MDYKRAKMREMAPLALPKTLACAMVVLSSHQQDSDLAKQSRAALRMLAGPSWGVGTAVQYLTGTQAEMAIACASPDDQATLKLARALSLRVHELAPNGQGATALVAVLAQNVLADDTP